MSGYIEITQGQTFPYLTVPLLPASGVALLPTDGATCFFEIRPMGGGPQLGGQCLINDDGTVTYKWKTADVLLPGPYYMRFRILYAAGSPEEVQEYVPPGRPDNLRIFPWGDAQTLNVDVYVQQTAPTDADDDFVWFVTDVNGNVIDIRVGDNTP